MKITFAQSDVIAALRAHIVSQGINLDGKSVDIKFTMKKNNAGIEADVTIENGVQLPDLSEAAEQAKPTLSVAVDNTPKEAARVVINDGVEQQTAVTEVADVAQATGTDDAAPVAETAPAKTTSLFN